MTERELITTCEAVIADLLRSPIHLERKKEQPAAGDVAYRLVDQDLDVPVCVIARRRFRPAEVPQLLATRTVADCPHRMLFTEYVTAGLAERLQEASFWYADAQGNAFIDLPGTLLLRVEGRKPPRVPTPKGQHFSVPGAKAIHFLIQHGPDVRATYRDIRAATGVSIDKIGKLIRELEQAGIVQIHGASNYKTLDADRLLRLWVEAYEAKLMPALHLGRYAMAPDTTFATALRQANEALGNGVVVGGEVAADALTGHLRPATLRLYLPKKRLADVRRDLRLAPSASGTVELCDLYSPALAGNRSAERVTVADASFVYAELMAANDSRLAETALRLREEHLAWTL